MTDESTSNENTESSPKKKQETVTYSSSIGEKWGKGNGDSQTTDGSESASIDDNIRRKTT